MFRPLAALLLSLAAQVPPSEAVTRGGDVSPPPGSAADLALWREGRAVTDAIVVERARAGKLQVGVDATQLLGRLEAAAAKAEPDDVKALLKVRQRLLEAWQFDYDVMSRQWPVDPTRGCGYPVLVFDSALRAPPGADLEVLATARGELRGCVDKARRAVKAAADANDALAAARAEAERALEHVKHEAAERREAREGAAGGKNVK